MHRRLIVRGLILPVLGLFFVLLLGGCSNKHVTNPLADIDSAQPDKVLFDRAMDAMKRNRFDVARMTLQTLINTYPDSEYLARAKLAVGDSWYAAGGSAAMAQAEAEYKDFITFFPNMAEASEAQLKIANIHYREMEKPDRDYTHAMRAEQEYRNLVLQYPDSPLIEQAKQRLLEVQEILAEREFRIARFYYMRQSWAAAQARLRSVIDTYPLYSGSDEALYILGQSYEGQVANVRAANLNEVAKGRLIKAYSDAAAAAYARILTRYPATDRVEDAKARLEAMQYQVPEPTPEALAQNQREEASRSELGKFGSLWSNFSSHPDTSAAARVGEPTLIDPQQTSATALIQQANTLVREAQLGASGGNNSLSVETIKAGEPPPSQETPRAQPAGGGGPIQLEPLTDAAPGGAENGAPATPPAPASPGPEQTGIGELIPERASPAGSAQPSEANAGNDAPGAQSETPPQAPAQVNQAESQSGSPQAESGSKEGTAESSSSRPKKKKGFLGVF